ncbi:MAG: flagellar biosynthesis protein FlhB [Deltaproteobacteria bacterium]|nr:flagellar biosynthesis protein FlhB [Deltaproteobacteria bacterium]MBW1736392.1 flagellar biosynthesis protein FlhB [Deltaproteobacteria bacterium]MBW1908131.1 flagellar biosynthesis protein FlhB [Deltaproteobacteria bacterium]MBW2032210.1 flagellar biosynthesis protein FlhB [Deltaproteobacteria bacterium]MBW2113783.1 flagellar biosynthesis protein FlhB [Deltaproteobacteria bacterium]
MPEGSNQEKTEPATPKRRQEAREKGQVAQSREISSTLVLLSGLGFFALSGSWMFLNLSEFMGGIFQNINSLRFDGSSVYPFLLEVLQRVFMILMPLMLLVLIAGIAANLLQVGFLFTGKPLVPKLSKLNPINGIKKLFSLRSLVELVKSVFKLLFVGGIAFLLLKGELETIPSLMQMGVGDILSFIGRVAFKICFYTCLALIILAALDYAYQRWQHEKDLKMTKQEVKDELKQREGDPIVKARIKSIQREMSQRRMMEMVPEADVVITNPTNLAIALKYTAEGMMAPRVIAKGAGFIAERIKEIAREKGIPIIENKPLAQTLFKVVGIGDFIPVNLYRAVAEILAYVYRLKGMRNTV